MTCSAPQRYALVALVFLATSWGCAQKREDKSQISHDAQDYSKHQLEIKYDVNGDGRVDRLVLSRFWPMDGVSPADRATDSVFESAEVYLADNNQVHQLAFESQPYSLSGFYTYLSDRESHSPALNVGSVRLYVGEYGRCILMIPRPLGSGTPNKVLIYDANKRLSPIDTIPLNIDSVFVANGKLYFSGIEMLRSLGGSTDCSGTSIDYYPHLFYSFSNGRVTLDTSMSAEYNSKNFVWLGLDSVVIRKSVVCTDGDRERPKYRVVPRSKDQ